MCRDCQQRYKDAQVSPLLKNLLTSVISHTFFAKLPHGAPPTLAEAGAASTGTKRRW